MDIYDLKQEVNLKIQEWEKEVIDLIEDAAYQASESYTTEEELNKITLSHLESDLISSLLYYIRQRAEIYNIGWRDRE